MKFEEKHFDKIGQIIAELRTLAKETQTLFMILAQIPHNIRNSSDLLCFRRIEKDFENQCKINQKDDILTCNLEKKRYRHILLRTSRWWDA